MGKTVSTIALLIVFSLIACDLEDGSSLVCRGTAAVTAVDLEPAYERVATDAVSLNITKQRLSYSGSDYFPPLRDVQRCKRSKQEDTARSRFYFDIQECGDQITATPQRERAMGDRIYGNYNFSSMTLTLYRIYIVGTGHIEYRARYDCTVANTGS